MKHVVACVVLLLSLPLLTAVSGGDKTDDKKDDKFTFKAGDVTIRVEPTLTNFEFSKFEKKADKFSITVTCIALWKEGQTRLGRWRAYDADGVQYDNGPLAPGGYTAGEKFKIEIGPINPEKGKLKEIKIMAK